jgi:hypothetical protein
LPDVTDNHDETAARDAPALRAPDRRGRASRQIAFEWEIANDGKGHRRLAVLTIGFRKAGINYTNYERHTTEFIAGIRNEDEDTTGTLPTRSYEGLSTLGVCRQETSRFSQKQLAAFAEHAARTLKERFAAGDPAVTAYFTPAAEQDSGEQAGEARP